jgi:hypothetical protein
MTWTIRSIDEPDRWLTHHGDGWEADPATTARLSQPHYTFPLTPTGPFIEITDESSLLAAAAHLMPGAAVTGDPPTYPPVPSRPGVIY